MGSHCLLFGVREAGVERLFIFANRDGVALDWLWETTRALAGWTPEHVVDLLAPAARGGDGEEEEEEGDDGIYLPELLRGLGKGRGSCPAPARLAHDVDAATIGPAAAVVDVDQGALDFYFDAEGGADGGQPQLCPGLPHVLRVSWGHLDALGTRAGAAFTAYETAVRRRWQKPHADEEAEVRAIRAAVDDGGTPSLLPFLTHLM